MAVIRYILDRSADDNPAVGKALVNLDGTMRLGSYACRLKTGTRAYEAYGAETIYERHRHRYEVNGQFRPLFEENGLVVCGWHEESQLIEMMEIKDHPWFVGCQFHPVFQSRPLRPHPLFRAFVDASLKFQEEKRRSSMSEIDSTGRSN